MQIRRFVKTVLATGLLCISAAHAQVSVMIPANPGGGWDATGRYSLQTMRETGIYTGTANFTNRGGAGGTIGLAEFQRSQKGKPDAIAAFGAITVGSIALNNSPVQLDKFKPIARLTAEYIVLAVKADSPYKTLEDFVTAFKANPGATTVGGGSAGGVDHIALALLAQSAQVPISSLNYIPQSGGADTVTAIVNGTLQGGISGLSEFSQFVETGRLRILAIATPERVKGAEDIPTFKEQGYDVEIANWRGILGSVDMPEANRQEWVERFAKLSETDEWKAVLERQNWESFFLPGDEFAKFIEAETARINKILKDAGLVK